MHEYQKIVGKTLEMLIELQDSYEADTPEHQAYEDMIQAIVQCAYTNNSSFTVKD